MGEGAGEDISREYIGDLNSKPEIMGDAEKGLTAVVDGRYEIHCALVPQYEVKDELIGDEKDSEWVMRVSDLKASSGTAERTIMNYGYAPDSALSTTNAGEIHAALVKYVENKVASGSPVENEGLKREVDTSVLKLYGVEE